MRDKNLQLEIANHIFEGKNFSMEDIESERVLVCIDAIQLTDIEAIELLKLCYKEYGEGRHSDVAVFKNSEGFYFTNDDEEALKMNQNEWVDDYCYFVVDEYSGANYEEFLEGLDAEYIIEFSQI